MISFGRDICGQLDVAERREWLVTNGIGGFASGTIAGTLTRRYHGLLMASLRSPNDRTLLVSKLDETAVYQGQTHKLHSNNWLGANEPDGFRYLEQFRLEGSIPVWTYAVADALLEKRVWMQQGANTTYVQYRLKRACAPLSLTVSALANYRHHHHETQANEWQMDVEPVPQGVKVIAYDGAIPFYLLSDKATATPQHQWHYRFFLLREANRGLPANEDHLCVGEFEITLQAGDAFVVAASIDGTPSLDGAAALAARQAQDADLVARYAKQQGVEPTAVSEPIQQLVLAADQFVVKRPLEKDRNGRSVIAGFHWFGDQGRDTMIALPGLTLTTGRPDVAAKILRTFAFHVNQGMLPNRFPETGTEPEYSSADAPLWYIEALRAYHAATGDDAFVRQLFPVLLDIVSRYRRGTRFDIHVDPADGLLCIGEAEQPLTWMNAKDGDWVVTPRSGKPIEINALWYNALCIMRHFAQLLGEDAERFEKMIAQMEANFGRFWQPDLGYCADLLDAPDGDDRRLRPNQLFAVSLPHSPLPPEQQKAVVDSCATTLLTSFGLRSLAPSEKGYSGSYGGNPTQRDSAYHQGTVWAWLMGAFVRAHLRVYDDQAAARAYLLPLLQQLADYGVGTIGEIFDGNPPFTPRGAVAHARSVAELLQAWVLTQPDEKSRRAAQLLSALRQAEARQAADCDAPLQADLLHRDQQQAQLAEKE